MDLIGVKIPNRSLVTKNIHSNPITTNYFLSIPYILSLVDLLTRRPVDFSQIGVNRVLMDLIGVRFPINGVRFPINAEEVRLLL